jgi:predicted nucleic acid-binding protein
VPGIVDLASNSASLPSEFTIDTNIIVEQFVGAYPTLYPQLSVNARRSASVFQSLASSNYIGIVTPTVLHEFMHFAVKTRYKFERLDNRAGLLARYGTVPNWSDLYKVEPALLQMFRPTLDQMCRDLVASGVTFASPLDASPADTTSIYPEILISVMSTYGLVSNDAAILLESRILGIADIVTMDKDFLRAQADFTIYTWL